MDIKTLLALAELKATKENSGHFTILKFSTHYKIFKGTPNLDGISERDKIWKLPAFSRLEDALIDYILWR